MISGSLFQLRNSNQDLSTGIIWCLKEISGDKDLSWAAVWAVAFPRVRLRHRIIYLCKRASTRTRLWELKILLRDKRHNTGRQPRCADVVHHVAKSLCNCSLWFLPSPKQMRRLLGGSGCSAGAEIIRQTRAQCPSTCRPVVGEVTRRARYWIPAEAERCPRDPGATAGQQWKADSAAEKARLCAEHSKGGQKLKTGSFHSFLTHVLPKITCFS